MTQDLLRPEVQAFIRQHQGKDPRALVLKYSAVAGVPMALVADQIKSRNKAREKLPKWHANPKIVFPPSELLEQASSQTTAQYKARWFSGRKMADLTGGTGVDTFYLSQNFQETDYVEPNATLVELAKHNFRILGVTHVKFYQHQAEEYRYNPEEEIDLLYLDPSRRKEGRKVFLFDQCEPNIEAIAPQLVKKAKTVLVKVSPLIDLEYAIRQLKLVHRIHIVSVNNDCKEVLLVLRDTLCDDPEIVAVNLAKTGHEGEFRFRRSDERIAEVKYRVPGHFLYEPHSAILKSGPFKYIGTRYALAKLHPQSHLYTSDTLARDFPGRFFEIVAICKYEKKTIQALLPERKANITTRNFPVSVDEIRKRTGIQPGGEHYIFATTDVNKKKILILTRKLF